MIGLLRRPGAKLVLLGVAVYLAFLVVNLPAVWLDVALARSSGGKLTLGETDGTVWKGQGALALRSSGGYRRLADLDWKLRPLSLFAGRLSFALSGSAPDALIRANLNFGLGGVTLNELDVNALAGAFAQAIPVLVLAKPEGRVRLQAPRLDRRRTAGTEHAAPGRLPPADHRERRYGERASGDAARRLALGRARGLARGAAEHGSAARHGPVSAGAQGHRGAVAAARNPRVGKLAAVLVDGAAKVTKDRGTGEKFPSD